MFVCLVATGIDLFKYYLRPILAEKADSSKTVWSGEAYVNDSMNVNASVGSIEDLEAGFLSA